MSLSLNPRSKCRVQNWFVLEQLYTVGFPFDLGLLRRRKKS